MKNVAKPNPSPSVATVTEPVFAKSFPSNSSQHAVEPQSPPMTPPKGKQNDIIPYVHDLSSPIQNKCKTMKYSTLTLQTKLQDLMHYCIRWPLLEDSL